MSLGKRTGGFTECLIREAEPGVEVTAEDERFSVAQLVHQAACLTQSAELAGDPQAFQSCQIIQVRGNHLQLTVCSPAIRAGYRGAYSNPALPFERQLEGG